MNVTIIDDQGTHLLIKDESQYAVIERRQNHFYNCHDEKRQGVGDLSGVDKILDDSDWTDQQTAQTMFDDVVARGNELAQRMR